MAKSANFPFMGETTFGAHWKRLALTIAFTLVSLTAVAQTAAPDTALVARANHGDAAAQVLLGESYAAGNGVTRDLKLAAEWYLKAAEQGNADGELHLASLYRDGGKNFPRDMAQAAMWYRKAAEQGNVTAQATLGVLYSIGQGVSQSDVEAYFWLALAASVKGPDQQKYAANRQLIGTHLTVDELDAVEERISKWLAEHPRANTAR